MQAALRELAETYRRAGEALAPIAGECRGCGECCRLIAGFALYATLLERTYLVRYAPRPAPDRLRGGDCPYLAGGTCTAREWRPLGCRTYFCDERFRDERRELHERIVREIGAISERHGIERDYAPVVERLAAELEPGPGEGGEESGG